MSLLRNFSRLISEQYELAIFYLSATICKQKLKNASKDPGRAQLETLSKILSRLNESTHWRSLNLGQIIDYSKFKSDVPITDYEFYRTSIDNSLISGKNNLSRYPIQSFVQTSGSTNKPKFLPITDWTIESSKINQKISSLSYALNLPDAFSGRILAITGATNEGISPCGIPFGSMSGLVADSMPRAIAKKYILPSWVTSHLNYNEKYLAIAFYALREKNLSLIATANSSTLNRLVDVILENHQILIEAVAEGAIEKLIPSSVETNSFTPCLPEPNRANDLKKILSGKSCSSQNNLVSQLWPKLSGLVTWKSGNCAETLSKFLRQCSSKVKVAEMGYLASEFRGTITVDDSEFGGLIPLHDTFFEFIPENSWNEGDKETLLIDQLEENVRYQIIATTGEGLLRYHINDLIEVSGYYNKTPLIRFVQKGRGVTNLTGEKLYEAHIIEAMNIAANELELIDYFYIALANSEKMQYQLFIESKLLEEIRALPLEKLKLSVDKALQILNCEYASKRESQRLAMLECKIVPFGLEERLRRQKLLQGQRENQLKISRLEYWNPEIEQVICT